MGDSKWKKLTLLIVIAIISPLLITINGESLHTPIQKLPPFSCGSSNSFSFCNNSLSINERVADLVSKLTLDEKISQLVNKATAIPRLDIPYYQWWSEALHGVAIAVGVEVGVTFNGTIRSATSFPQVILTAAAFDVHLWYRIAQVIGKEARAIYNEGQATGMTFWSPNINIFRDPRWGRGQETPGEDPNLTSDYAVSFVRGIQGDSFEGDLLIKDGSLQVSSCCKHLTAYDLDNWKGIDRFNFDARVTKQDMADTFQPPFRNCVEKGRASGIMCAYNRVNGVPNCADYDLLTTTARGKWGFQGYITSDCDAVSLLYETQHYAKSHEDAVAEVLKAGMDVNCGSYLGIHTKSAVEKGKVSESDIDRALHNLFSVRMRLGLFKGNPREQKYGDLGRKDICTPEHQDLALEAARHGIVLLKNSAKNMLPLSKFTTKSLAVIGPNADDAITLLGNYHGPPCKTITPLEGLKSYVGNTVFHRGCDTINCTSVAMDEAIKLARSSDRVVLVMGLNQDRESEELDRDELVLPGQQETLITSIAKASKKPVVLVIMCGGPVDISFAKRDPNIGSILWAGYPGEAGGRAIAEIIFGDHNPGGRLPVTWYPKDFIKVPMTDMRMRADPSSSYPGRTYRFYRGEKVFEFGYGLSYSNYSYNFVSVSQSMLNFKKKSTTDDVLQPSTFIPVSEIAPESCEDAKISVIVRVHNEGKLGGKHSILLFIRQEKSDETPMKQLVGFQTVNLNAKEESTVEFQVNPCQHFARGDEYGNLVVEKGKQYFVVEDQEYAISINA